MLVTVVVVMHGSELKSEGCGIREGTQLGRILLTLLRLEGSLIIILASPRKG